MNDELHKLAPLGVVCFGGEDWWYHNRGHCDMQLMRCCARHTTVLYVNSVVMRKPNVREGAMFIRRVRRKLRSMARGVVRADENFHVYSPLTAPVHHLPGARWLNQRALLAQTRLVMARLGLRRPIVWVNCPAACDTALSLPRSALVYQRTDRYEEYPGVDRRQISRYDRRLKAAADLTFYSSSALYEQERHTCRKAIYVEHGVDLECFATAWRDPRVPPELADLPRPIVGFFGGIDAHTFDIELAARVVELCPELTFVFVGNASLDIGPLARHPHVHLISQRPFEQIPHYGKCFDVCIMPWNRNEWIAACNPIKLKEYLALGKPVVSTPFPELARYDGLIRTATDAPSFAAAIRAALAEIRPDHVEQARAAVAGHSWQAKASQIISALPL